MAARVADPDAGGVSELLRLVDAEQRARAGEISALLGRVRSARRARTGAVSELLGRVDSTRWARAIAVSELLGHVAPQLVAIREEERELDRREARRFNVFKYLQTDELGLSRMIADLLDPAGDHCQGSVFLNAMLDILSDTGGKTQSPFGSLRAAGAKVVRERGIPSGGFIDITVDIGSDEGPFCLAFENKPYARDGYRQLRKYLTYLDEQYGSRFLLVYVPPYYREPDEAALPRKDRRQWMDRGQFGVMPYSGSEVSIEGWFAACSKLCEAERMRLYLGDAQTFCRQRFGAMTTHSMTHLIREHLSARPDQMHAALAVHDAWRVVRAEVCQRFLRHLRHRVEERLREEFPATRDLSVRWHYNDGRKNHIRLWISRDSWARSVSPGVVSDGCTMIMIHNSGRAPNGWYWGVRNPKSTGKMTEAEKERVEALKTALGRRGRLLAGGSTDWWPQWEYLARYRDWYPLAPDLADECEKGGGTITNYYVDGLLRIARLAIPVIDEVEAARTTASASTVAAADEAVSGQEPEPAKDAESPDPTESPDPADSGE